MSTAQRQTRGPWLGVVALGTLILLAVAAESIKMTVETRRLTERVLRDYATEAANRLAVAYDFLSGQGLVTALAPALFAPPTVGGSTLLRLVELSAATTAPCRGTSVDSLRFYFRFDPRARRLEVYGHSVPASARQVLSDSLFAVSRSIVAGDVSTLRINAAGYQKRSIVVGRTGPLAAEPVLYGFDTCSGSLAASYFPVAWREKRLLPAHLTGGVPNDSVLSVTVVRTAEQDTVFHSPQQYRSSYTGVVTPDWPAYRVTVTLRPAIVDRLVHDAVPRSRPWWLLGLLATGLALLGIASWELVLDYRRTADQRRFVAGLSHELRTPLAQIRLVAERLELGAPRTPAERDRSLAIIQQEAGRLSRLVENVLHVSRPASSEPQVPCNPVDLNDEITRAVDEFRPLVGTGTTFDVSLPAPITALANAAALRQVLLNLLDNAVKYGPPGQTVWVEATVGGRLARLSIEDQGPGILFEDRERVFRPFVRLGSDPSVPGSGIGLSVVNDLVEAMDGKVWIESGDSGGTRVVIELRIATTTDEPAPAKAEAWREA